MENIELLDNLDRDLAKTQASREAHVYIQNVINAYKRRIEALKQESDGEAK